jgi:mannose-6-phosphate isomerase-like protein (cupin superfamily)
VSVRRVHESQVPAVRAPEPNSRTLKHLAAPWTLGSEHLWVGLSEIDPGSSSNRHEHEAEEVFYVVEGRGSVEVGDDSEPIEAGTIVLVPPRTPHRLINEGEGVLKVLCSAAPPFTLADFDAAHRIGTARGGPR